MNDHVYCFHCHNEFKQHECVQVTDDCWICAEHAPEYYAVVDQILADMEESLENQTGAA
jgi:hypothetical protein